MPRRFVSTAPEHVRRRYLRGRCWVLADELVRATGLELWGLRDENGDLHHAFAADPAAGLAHDIRGTMPIDRVAEGSAARGGRCVPIARADMIAISGAFDAAEIREARRVLRAHLRKSAAGPAPEKPNYDTGDAPIEPG
ncbi:hypothetical protein [Defluviimonas salinarum]|uniref:Transposase n=1 Tax=Defluviimonas salinarum TaxID=2992147 RepID=A0ABT3J5P0_9RHOB|nr:hypothetical protein [Defluviimonas salinarum]MCW3782970.1 hypothetical protein [Defluviimonas salinarum]